MTLFCDSDWCLFNEGGFCERSRGSILGGMCDRYDDPEYTHLKEENEKLRELVRDMYTHIDQDSECPKCGYEPDGNMYTERVRELGIKVN